MIFSKDPIINELNATESEVFKNYFLENGEFVFEGCWLRNQRPENAKKSGYIDETTVRRRYIHFYDTYCLIQDNGKNYLALKNYYYYVTHTAPKNEIDNYLRKIIVALNANGFNQSENRYIKGNMEIIIETFDKHPRNTTEFPYNYSSCDVTVHNKGYDFSAIKDRMWGLSHKMYRMPDKRGNPTYIADVKDIIKYLPAQIEMGCGPSIGANIPPLYDMHEIYKVQNHITGKFYTIDEDTLMLDIINKTEEMFNRFARVPLACIRAQHTKGYKNFDKLYKAGYFKGVVYNNNFDRLVKRFDIPENILRVYDINAYIPKAEFDSNVKSLICIGCHADRRQIQLQARRQGLKIIFIDPEGFYNETFEPYPIEGPKNEDLILKTTFEDAMESLVCELKKDKNFDL